MTNKRSCRALVLGCGGPVGFAWSVGALRAVEDELRWDAREAEVIIGTSAGAELAAMLGAGLGNREMHAAQSGEMSSNPTLVGHFGNDQMARGVDYEVEARERHGVGVIRIEPGAAELSAMVANFMDVRRREATLAAASRTSNARVRAALEAASLSLKTEATR